MTKPKPAKDLTDQHALQRLFPKEVRIWLRAELKRLNKQSRCQTIAWTGDRCEREVGHSGYHRHGDETKDALYWGELSETEIESVKKLKR